MCRGVYVLVEGDSFKAVPRLEGTSLMRFERQIRKTDYCWEWEGYTQHGYGVFGGKKHRAHRLSYVLYAGTFPWNRLLMHSCDNRKCVNPEHLTPGTYADNSEDRDRKGRTARPNARFSVYEVLAMRALWRAGFPDSYIAGRFNVSRQTAWSVASGRSYGHLDDNGRDIAMEGL